MKSILRAIKFLPNYRRLIIPAVVLGVVTSGIVTAIPLAIQRIIDELFASISKGEISLSTIMFPFLIWLGLRLLLNITDLLTWIVQDNLWIKAVTDFKVMIANRLELLSISYFEKHLSGKLVSKINQSPFKFGHWVTSAFTDYVQLILTALFALAVLVYKLPIIGLVVLPLAFLYSWYTFKTMKINRGYWKKNRKAINESDGIITENISMVAHIRALAVEGARGRLFAAKVSEHGANLRQMFSFQHRRNFILSMLDLVLYAVPIAIFAFMAYSGSQKPTDIYVLSVYLGSISAASSRLSKVWQDTQDTNDTIAETLEVIDSKSSVVDPVSPKKIGSMTAVSLESVSLKYEDTKIDAVSGLELTINKGETVALVGRSGSGKSTIIKLLLRFYDPDQGKITINGTDIRHFRQNDLRQKFGVVMQDVALFNDTVANNIAIANPNATRKDVIRAAKLAHAHEFITSLPDGYDTLVGERGVKLSGGEKQRVSIARAVLRNPEVVLLDEATSALDSESEKYVQDGLKKLLKDRTAVIIAHRLSTVAHADKIVVMDKGKIVETGTFEELKKTKGHFASLLAHQQL